MRTQRDSFPRAAALLLALSFMLVFSAPAAAAEAEPPCPADRLSLSVALYPYVPDPERCETAARDLWAGLHPDVPLVFVPWDCYHDALPEDLDVFVFDAMLLTDCAARGLLLPVPGDALEDPEDFLAFALEGSRVDGVLYAVPQLLCTHLLFTRPGDTALSGAADIPSLYAVLGDSGSDSAVPGEGRGLLVDMSGGFSKVNMYLDSLCDVNGAYSDYSVLPDPASFSGEALRGMRLLCTMGGREQVSLESEDPYMRARWFARGLGRAYIGYTESMTAMGDYARQVCFRPFSYSASAAVNLFSGDLVGVRADIAQGKVSLAFELVRLLTGSAYAAAVGGTDSAHPVPAFLLPARLSAYDALIESSSVYEGLRDIVLMPDNRLFRIGAGVLEYAAALKKALPELVFGP